MLLKYWFAKKLNPYIRDKTFNCLVVFSVSKPLSGIISFCTEMMHSSQLLMQKMMMVITKDKLL